MASVCMYFQVHQPFRLRRYGVLDIGRSADYFDDAANRRIMEKVAAKCYLPANALILDLIRRHRGRFKVAYSITATALEQFAMYAPAVLASFRRLADTGCVEFLGETAYHSLSFVYDRAEFDRQVDLHMDQTEAHFRQLPTVFRNTELVFNNELAAHLERRGFSAVLAEGADRVLGWRSPNFVHTAKGAPGLKVLLKNYRLSDDIAFRFSDRNWSQHPLDAPRYASWINAINGSGDVVNLFMDYETFGEHQWAESGIFAFLEHLPAEILKHPDNAFRTPREVGAMHRPSGEIDVPAFVSWADTERDLSAWLGNPMQQAAAKALYGLGPAVLSSGDERLIESWRRLTTSDHLYYMCTKWFADGDVHKYFNPYESPYEAYIAFLNVLNDMALRTGFREPGRLVVDEVPGRRVAVAGAATLRPAVARRSRRTGTGRRALSAGSLPSG